MTLDDNFFNLSNPDQGIFRELAPGVSTRVFVGDKAMLSVATLAANAESEVHSHAEKQWGVLLEGEVVRYQDGKEVAVKAGDFWLTPGGVPHSVRAGANGARILDIFSPPREAYRKAGKGFAGD